MLTLHKKVEYVLQLVTYLHMQLEQVRTCMLPATKYTWNMCTTDRLIFFHVFCDMFVNIGSFCTAFPNAFTPVVPMPMVYTLPSIVCMLFRFRFGCV